jgi:hypothetical protein
MNFKNLIITGLAALTITSCSKNEEVVNEVENGEEAVVSFNLSFDSNQIKTKTDGTAKLFYSFGSGVKSKDVSGDNILISESVTIGQDYTFNFWLSGNGNKDAFHETFVTDLNHEDSFYASETFTVTKSTDKKIILKRPYAKIQVLSKDGLTVAESAKIEIERLGVAFDITTGKVKATGTITKDCTPKENFIAEAFGFVDETVKNAVVRVTINNKTITKIVDVIENTNTVLTVNNFDSISPIITISYSKEWDTIYYESTDLEISNLSELKAFRDAVNSGESYSGKTIKLTSNIDLTDENWEPIGNYSNHNPFSGIFDGQNYTIKNLNINKENESCVGFFGYVSSGEIKNVTFENATIIGNQIVSVVSAESRENKYQNITVKGLINITANRYAGGIIGSETGNSEYMNIKLEANDNSLIKVTDDAVGGFAGYLNTDIICNSVSINNIQLESINGRIGGLTCGIANGVFSNCELNNIKINSNNNTREVGSFSGRIEKWGNTTTTITNCKINNNPVTINDIGTFYNGSGNVIIE